MAMKDASFWVFVGERRKPVHDYYDDVHITATKASSMAQGLFILIRDGSPEARNAVDVIAEQLQDITCQLARDLDSVNRP